VRACVAGWRAGGVCAGGGTGGAAGPCHAGRPRGRTRGRRSRRGAGGQGGLVTRPASQTEVCPQPAMGGQITRNTLHGKAPANAWGPPGRLGQKGTGTDGLVIPCPLTPWWAPGLCVWHLWVVSTGVGEARSGESWKVRQLSLPRARPCPLTRVLSGL
jgi:hypothetical protein